jgi:hypothetical protein
MISFYNWLVCKLFKRCAIEINKSPLSPFERYCEENPWAAEAKIFDL